MSPIYVTGLNEDGDALLGGVWTLWSQEGFPLEMSHLTVRDMPGFKVDWAEAMFDASRTDNCPVLMDHIQNFLGEEILTHLKAGFVRAARSGKTWDELIAEKRTSGAVFLEHLAVAERAFNTKPILSP